MIKEIEKEIAAFLPAGTPLEITASEKKEFGHYATNVAFRLAPAFKKSPLQIAQDLAAQLSGKGIFAKAEAAPPGFLNLWLKDEALQNGLKSILKQKKNYGSATSEQPKKINVEFVSANPTGPLTMANGGRGGFYGDVLASVLAKAGHKVTREYYVNDAGNQVRALGESILAVLGVVPPAETHYQGAYVKSLAVQLKKFKKSSAEDLGKKAAAILLKGIKKSLKNAGIKHDVFFSEDANLRKKKELDKALAALRAAGAPQKKDGAEWLGDNVLVKSDGAPTYFLADLAYHYDKFVKRKFDIAIDIWGADHHGYIARMKAGVHALGIDPERLHIRITQLVRLMKDGQEMKMSKRTGNFITLDELIEETGADAARFFFLMHSLDAHMDFDMNLAKERSQKNPVFYAQYAYVRVLNILAKAKKAPKADLSLLKTESEQRLILELIKYPDIVAQSAKDYQVHRLATYALDLARAFHNFYEKERVVGAGKELEKARMLLLAATRLAFENLFDLLGISKPKRM